MVAGWKAKIEGIIGDKLANRPHDAEISKWLDGLDERMKSQSPMFKFQ